MRAISFNGNDGIAGGPCGNNPGPLPIHGFCGLTMWAVPTRLTGPPDAVDGRGLLIIPSNNLFDSIGLNSLGGGRSPTLLKSRNPRVGVKTREVSGPGRGDVGNCVLPGAAALR